MNILKKLALVASLTLAGMSAHAGGTFIQMDAGDPGDFENSWSINSSVLGETGPKGTAITDFFLFNVPDDEYVSFSLFGAKTTFFAKDGSLGFQLYGLGADPFLVDSEAGVIPHSIEGGLYTLTSGTYELDVYGAFTGKDGTYDVSIFGSPVPEPSGWALLLAGLGVTGLLARRRQQRG